MSRRFLIHSSISAFKNVSYFPFVYRGFLMDHIPRQADFFSEIWSNFRGGRAPVAPPPPPLPRSATGRSCDHYLQRQIVRARIIIWLFTLNTPGLTWLGKGSIGAKLHSGSTMTRKLVSFLQTWQRMGSDWPSFGSYSTSSWLIFGSSLTRNGVWPQLTLSRVTLTRVFLECWYRVCVRIMVRVRFGVGVRLSPEQLSPKQNLSYILLMMNRCNSCGSIMFIIQYFFLFYIFICIHVWGGGGRNLGLWNVKHW